MCGIAGFLSFSNSAEELKSSTQSLEHRGPDAAGYYFSGEEGYTLGLGHRRLSIIDLSEAGNQPMFSHCGRYCIVYNGELYNFNDIRRDKLPGISWHSTSDTEVIIEAFARYGTACFEWFNGMFALAIWDKETKTLTLARDQVGIKPLYYYYTGNKFVFASEIKAISQIVPDLQINKAAIPAFLHTGFFPHPYSIYEGVIKLQAGNYMQVMIGGNQLLSIADHSFWKISDKISTQVQTDEKAAREELHGLLKDSVQRQLVSDVPIGTFLSGGVDSSLITAIATGVSPGRVKTFSIAVTDGKINEAPFAAAVAKHLNTDHYELPISQQDIMEMIPGFMDVYDEPFCDSSAFPTLLVSKLARRHVTVALSGDGGDELFWGYGSYLWAKRVQHPVLRAGAPLIYAATRLLNSRYKRAGMLFADYPKEHFKSHLFSQDHYFFTEHEINKLLLQGQTDFNTLNRAYGGRELDIVEQVSCWDLENYLKDNLLVKVDRASMQYSLETRVPLLDYRLVEFALNLHPSLKIKDGVMKYLLKEILYEYVPKTLLDRPKWGFGVPLNKWLKTELKWLVDTYCAKEVVENAGLVDYQQVKRLVTLFNKGGHDYLYNRIWALTVLHWFIYGKKS